jgi:hypothetical protein
MPLLRPLPSSGNKQGQKRGFASFIGNLAEITQKLPPSWRSDCVLREDHSGKKQLSGRVIRRCRTCLPGLLMPGAWSLVGYCDDHAIQVLARKIVELLYHWSVGETEFRSA